jgi:hypothetical protein
MDGVKNGTESAKDCGGSCPNKCGIGLTCNGPADCTTNNCVNGVCAPTCATCSSLGYTCGNPSDGCGHTLNCGSCASPQTCGGYGTNVCGLVLDDFSLNHIDTNLLGGEATSDHMTKSIVNGQLRFTWDGSSNYDDYLSSFRNPWCEYNLSAYTKMRLQMQASASGHPVDVVLAMGNGSCPNTATTVATFTITPTTTLQYYPFDISGITNRNKALWVEIDPHVTDGTTYYVDNIEFGTAAGGGGGSCATCSSLGYNCGTASDGCGNTLNCGTCSSPQTCGGYGPNVCGLVMDDFSGTNVSKNLLGGVVESDNLTKSLSNGELKFSWNHSSNYDDYLTYFRADSCEYNLSAYEWMRFQLQAGVAGKPINVVLAMGDGSCPGSATSLYTWTITSTTSLDWYYFKIGVVGGRNKAMWVELDPQVLDGTTYYVDNIEFK